MLASPNCDPRASRPNSPAKTPQPDTAATLQPDSIKSPNTKTPEIPQSPNVSTRAASKKAAELEALTRKTPSSAKSNVFTRAASKKAAELEALTPKTPSSAKANVSTRAASKNKAELEAMDPKPCPGITVVYPCGHSWKEHVRDCNMKVIPSCPSNINSQPKFACIMCGPSGSDKVGTETILKAKTLGYEFEYWLKGLMKAKDEALETVEADKFEIEKLGNKIMKLERKLGKGKEATKEIDKSKKMTEDLSVKPLALEKDQDDVAELEESRKENAKLKRKLEKEEENARELEGHVKDLTKQADRILEKVKTIIPAAVITPSATVLTPAPAVKAPPPRAVLTGHSHSQIQLDGGSGTAVVVGELYENCGHNIKLLGEIQDEENERTAAVILKKGCCSECLKFIKSSEKEKISTAEKQLGKGFDKYMDNFGGEFTANWDEDSSTSAAKGIVEKFFKNSVDNVVKEMKKAYEGMVDWHYGVQVMDNVAEMELALRQGDESQFVLKRNEMWKAREGCEEGLRECADTFEVKILNACKGGVDEWMKEKEDHHSVISAQTEDVEMT